MMKNKTFYLWIFLSIGIIIGFHILDRLLGRVTDISMLEAALLAYIIVWCEKEDKK